MAVDLDGLEGTARLENTCRALASKFTDPLQPHFSHVQSVEEASVTADSLRGSRAIAQQYYITNLHTEIPKFFQDRSESLRERPESTHSAKSINQLVLKRTYNNLKPNPPLSSERPRSTTQSRGRSKTRLEGKAKSRDPSRNPTSATRSTAASRARSTTESKGKVETMHLSRLPTTRETEPTAIYESNDEQESVQRTKRVDIVFGLSAAQTWKDILEPCMIQTLSSKGLDLDDDLCASFLSVSYGEDNARQESRIDFAKHARDAMYNQLASTKADTADITNTRYFGYLFYMLDVEVWEISYELTETPPINAAKNQDIPAPASTSLRFAIRPLEALDPAKPEDIVLFTTLHHAIMKWGHGIHFAAYFAHIQRLCWMDHKSLESSWALSDEEMTAKYGTLLKKR